MSDIRQAWSDFLNPDLVRTKFISAGLFMVAHETLIDTIKRHPLGFFSDHFTQDAPKQTQKYRDKVLALDPKGKMDPLRGSIAWLASMGVIDAEDEKIIQVATDQRNVLAHELSGLMAGVLPPDYLLAFAPVHSLIDKIERWWIVNFHMEIMQDDLPEGPQVDDIVPGPIWSLQMLAEVAMTEGDAAWKMHRMFEGQWPAADRDHETGTRTT